MSAPVLRRMAWTSAEEKNPRLLLGREWLVANGLGGYASGTVSGACTRRYHGLLIAALPAPLGRTVMLNHLAAELRCGDAHNHAMLDVDEPIDDVGGLPSTHLAAFRLEWGLPVWTFRVGAVELEKRIVLPYLQNTVHISYRLTAGPPGTRLRLRPAVHFRPHEAPIRRELTDAYMVAAVGQRFEIRSQEAPPLRLRFVSPHATLVLDGGRFREVQYPLEAARGYESHGSLWSPGYFRANLAVGDEATLVASTEDWETLLAAEPSAALAAEVERRQRLLSQAPPEARHGPAGELVLAADQFIIRPTTRVADAAIAHAAGDDVRTVIAGYHWFTDWGRDTMISLEGLTLATGRQSEAGYILRTFARYVRDGLLPNLFPEGEREGLYHTADATLWYFHALSRYLRVTGDVETLHLLLPTLTSIVDHHVRGTRFGIGVDPSDGLLTQGELGYQLTWMDAKVGDWVVTPRRGKAVEINALWYNALCWLEQWTSEAGDLETGRALRERAELVHLAFNRRFWSERHGYLFDVVDGEQGNDPALRPNQIFALSLDHPVLERRHWPAVLEQVTKHLLTPVGLRSLAPGHPDYKPTYDGDLRSRDAAYHQGTVWGWLLGPYIDAWLRVHSDDCAGARRLLAGFEPHLDEACLGSISEIFDAEAPYHPRGCIAQAWSVAELLRCWLRTAAVQTG